VEKLRALLIEDNPLDAELLLRELRRGYDIVTYERVETAEALSTALDKQPWDVVVSDYSLPQFSAPAALSLIKARGIDIPFIIVSGTIGEETAVEAMRAGAHDFMTKGKLARLLPAIEREIKEAAVRIERKEMHEQLLVSDRMASVGTLAAGVAHEINNPLAALMANLDFAIAELKQFIDEAETQSASEAPNGRAGESGWSAWLKLRSEQVLEPLHDTRESAERVRVIVRDLKVFSRSEEEQRGPVDVRRVMESSLRMAWNEIRHRARLIKDYGEVPLVQASESRLGQVFLNLIVNAAQAIPEGRAESNDIRVATRLDGHERVMVEVRDTGAGIPPANLARIFDPFFTTKAVGQGTGLGLAICQRIIASLSGEITVESSVGKGTTFRVFLPVAKTQKADDQAPPPPRILGRRARILVVDDEPMVVSAIRRALSREHDVVPAASARDAKDRIANGERFDLILCDLMMPQMTGIELHAELTRTARDQADRIVFMTGGAFTAQARQFLETVRNARVEKPFDFPSLKTLIHSLAR
jgi:signal transduction histidine kinase